MTGRAGQQIQLLVRRPATQQAEPQRAVGNALQQTLSGAAKQPRQRFDERLLVYQSIGEAIGLDRLARLGQREMLPRQDAVCAEHDLHVIEPIGQPQQHLQAAGEGDRLKLVEPAEQFLP